MLGRMARAGSDDFTIGVAAAGQFLVPVLQGLRTKLRA